MLGLLKFNKILVSHANNLNFKLSINILKAKITQENLKNVYAEKKTLPIDLNWFGCSRHLVYHRREAVQL